MGLEANCTVRHARKSVAGLARLEEKILYFRADVGALHLKIPFAQIRSADARRGVLTVKWSAGEATFDLGAAAEKWSLKIRYPRSRIEKLGIKPDSLVSVLHIDDKSFWKEIEGRAGKVSDGKPAAGSDFILVGVEDRSGLQPLRALQKSIQPAGAIWVVWPKGQPHIKEDHVRAAALAVGLVDVKVMSFSATHSALKLMIPRARR
ncbi:MAG: hypothetical protein ACRD5G_03975 [Candidatus Acidiferrales bacterium]